MGFGSVPEALSTGNDVFPKPGLLARHELLVGIQDVLPEFCWLLHDLVFPNVLHQ
jgi:hypothetical protein